MIWKENGSKEILEFKFEEIFVCAQPYGMSPERGGGGSMYARMPILHVHGHVRGGVHTLKVLLRVGRP